MKRQIINLILGASFIAPHSAFAMDEITVNNNSIKSSVLGKRNSDDLSTLEHTTKKTKLNPNSFDRKHYQNIALDSSTASPQEKAYANLQLGEMYMFGTDGGINYTEAYECFHKVFGNSDARHEDGTKAGLRLTEMGILKLGINPSSPDYFVHAREIREHEYFPVDRTYKLLKSSLVSYSKGNYFEAKKGFKDLINMGELEYHYDTLLAKLKLDDMEKQGL